MMNALSISLSGINAAQKWVNVSAHNIANVQTDNFKEKTAVMKEQPNGGVIVSDVINSRAQIAPQPVQAGGGAGAGQNDTNAESQNEAFNNPTYGFTKNDVNINKQMVDLIAGKNAYMVNLSVLKKTDQMLGKIIDLKA